MDNRVQSGSLCNKGIGFHDDMGGWVPASTILCWWQSECENGCLCDDFLLCTDVCVDYNSILNMEFSIDYIRDSIMLLQCPQKTASCGFLLPQDTHCPFSKMSGVKFSMLPHQLQNIFCAEFGRLIINV